MLPKCSRFGAFKNDASAASESNGVFVPQCEGTVCDSTQTLMNMQQGIVHSLTTVCGEKKIQFDAIWNAS